MKGISCLILFLIPYIKSECEYLIYRFVELDTPLPGDLPSSSTVDTYTYTRIKFMKRYDYLYYYFIDNSFGLNNVSYCFTEKTR